MIHSLNLSTWFIYRLGDTYYSAPLSSEHPGDCVPCLFPPIFLIIGGGGGSRESLKASPEHRRKLVRRGGKKSSPGTRNWESWLSCWGSKLKLNTKTHHYLASLSAGTACLSRSIHLARLPSWFPNTERAAATGPECPKEDGINNNDRESLFLHSYYQRCVGASYYY